MLWKAAVGLGFSSVSVAQGRLYTMGHQDGKDIVYCLDAAHRQAALASFLRGGARRSQLRGRADRHAHGSRRGRLHPEPLGRSCSASTRPTARSAGRRNLKSLRVPGWGFSGSPLIHDKLLLLNLGKAGMALEKDTGKKVWASADEEAGYSTPMPFQRGGGLVRTGQ